MTWTALISIIAAASAAGFVVGILVSTGSHWRQSVKQSQAYQRVIDELEARLVAAEHRAIEWEARCNGGQLSRTPGPTHGTQNMRAKTMDRPADWYVSTSWQTPAASNRTHTGDDSLPEQIRRRLDGGDGT